MPWLLLSTGMWLWVKESRNPGFHPSPHESTSDVCFSSRASRQLRQGERGPVDRGMIHRREACEDEEVIFGDGGCGDVRFGGGECGVPRLSTTIAFNGLYRSTIVLLRILRNKVNLSLNGPTEAYRGGAWASGA